jgi:hypothetical protein
MSRSTTPHGMGKSSPSRVMHDGWCGKVIPHAASFKLAFPRRHYVLDPFAFPTIGERNQESLRRSKNTHWRPVALPDFRPTCVRMPKPGNRPANRLVIRFVTAKLKAATHRLRNRTFSILWFAKTSRATLQRLLVLGVKSSAWDRRLIRGRRELLPRERGPDEGCASALDKEKQLGRQQNRS